MKLILIAMLATQGVAVPTTPVVPSAAREVLVALAPRSVVVPTPATSLGVNSGRELLFPPAPWAQDDPADSLYTAARRALTRKDYETAARLFDAIVTRFPRSTYAPDALYWKGFALQRNGNLDDAVTALEAQAKRYPQAATRSDASALLIQIQGQLAQRGDPDARQAPPSFP